MNKPKDWFLAVCMVLMLLGVAQSAVAGSKYTSAGTIINPNFYGPRGIYVDSDQSIWVANSTWASVHTHAGVYQFNASDNTFMASYLVQNMAGVHLTTPHGIHGNVENGISYLYVSDYLSSGIYKYTYGSLVASLQNVGSVGGQQVAVGTYQGSPAVYVGSNNSQFTILDTNLAAVLTTIGPDNALGVAIDSRSITYATNDVSISRYDQSGNPLSSIPLADYGAGFLYGLAIAPSGHILASDTGARSIFVVKPNGQFDFTIDLSSANGELTHLAVNPLTGRVYLSVSNPDNRVYMFDVPCLRAPDTIVESLPVPPPTSVSTAVSSMAQNDINYQIAFINLDTPSLQKAAENYADPNINPSKIAAVNANTSVSNVVQSHINLLQMQQTSNGPQNFQMGEPQYLADFKHRGLAAHMQKKQKGRRTQPLSGQPSEHHSGLGAAPTLELMNDQKNFSVWMQNAFNQTDNGITPTLDANRSRMHAWTFGADAMVSKQSRAGVFGGSSKSNVHLMNTPLTQDDTKKKYLGFYGVHFFDIKREKVTPSLDTNVMLGKGHMNHARDLSITGYPMIATSNQGFWDLSTRLRLTVPHHVGEHLIISPYAYAGWMYFKQNQVTEQGASVFNQIRPAQIFQVAEGSLGTQISGSFDKSFGMVMPSLKLGITQTGTINKTKVLPIALAGGGTFDSAQIPLKQFAYDIGTSVAFKFTNNLSFVASYLAEYGKNKYKRNEVLIEARLYF